MTQNLVLLVYLKARATVLSASLEISSRILFSHAIMMQFGKKSQFVYNSFAQELTQ